MWFDLTSTTDTSNTHTADSKKLDTKGLVRTGGLAMCVVLAYSQITAVGNEAQG